MAIERLQKILSNAGVASRRSAEAMIVAGRIAVNGEVRSKLGARADAEADEITVDGVPVRKDRYRYLALNKPAGVLSTARDERGRRTVMDLVSDAGPTLHPVGRLDQESEGLLLLTSDGALTELLTHPRHEVRKEYLVAIDQPLARKQLERLVRGVWHEGEQLKADSIDLVSPGGSPDNPDPRWLLVGLHGGRKREIRRMLSVLGRRVVSLRRIRIGSLPLGSLAPGESRVLEPEEVIALYETAKRSEAQERGSSIAATRTAREPTEVALPSPIAIDGAAASGKTTLGRALAERLGYAFLDTGLMYRAFTLAAIRAGIVATDETACVALSRSLVVELIVGTDTRICLAGDDVTDSLRAPEVEAAVSGYSAIAEVREEMVARQRAFAAAQRAVLAGRDIGTVVLPDAPVKLFLTASVEARAERRGVQAREWGGEQTADEASRDISGRDEIDSNRASGPLKVPEGAVVIDTTTLDAEAMIAFALERITAIAKRFRS